MVAVFNSRTRKIVSIFVSEREVRDGFFFFSSRRRHTRWNCDWSLDVCSSDLVEGRNLTVDFVQDDHQDRLAAEVGEFARRGVDVIVGGGQDAVLEAAITATA